MDASATNGNMTQAEMASDLAVGDMLWSRVPGYPFWPCMISYDPLLGIFSKSKEPPSEFVSYHVQYFGEKAHHGWTTKKNVLKYEGQKIFNEIAESMKKESKNLHLPARQKFLGRYFPTPSHRSRWELAVSEAETAFVMTRTERIETFTFIYTMPKTKKENGHVEQLEQSKLENGKNKSSASESDDVISLDSTINKEPVISGPRLEHLCQICEKPSPDMICSGSCSQSFHSSCLGVLVAPQNFLCDECISGNHRCFSCKSSEGIVKKCTVNKCGKFYHVECFQKFPMTDVEKFICPLHFCLTCYNERPRNPSMFRSRFMKCFRCPVAYHSKEHCMAAGCQQLSQLRILCPEHFVPDKKRPYQSVINIDYCFICGKAGSLVCCESCPAAFHTACLEIEPPDGKYFCDECVSKKHICYGNIVWVKIGIYRWWPARVKNPKDLPANILKMKHSVGEFCIQYFGTYEYYWTHRGRVFPYSEEDTHSRGEIPENGKTSLQTKFNISLAEAACAFDDWSLEKQKENNCHEKLPAYKHIKTNKPIGNVQILTKDAESCAKCLCKPGQDACGYSSDCLNRSMLVECHPLVCPAGDSCMNQMFQKRQSAPATPFRTLNRGYALKNLEDIKKGSFVIEYVGDLIDLEECKRRLAAKHEVDDNNFYFLTLDKGRIIDAGPKGNLSRFMNHSCAPNCETQKWIVNGDYRVGLFANQDIPAGTELTFDYMLDTLDNEKLKCRCGEPNCRGAIGEKPSKSDLKDGKESKERGKKRKRKSAAKLKKDDYCYLCKEAGSLKMCSRKGCSKGYHLSCLEQKEVVNGPWQCPWHFCDICGKLSRYLCSLCSNSFCEKHKTNSDDVPSETYICPDHNCESVEDDVEFHYCD